MTYEVYDIPLSHKYDWHHVTDNLDLQNCGSGN